MKEYMLLAYPKYPSSYGDPESFVICNSQVMDHYRINRGNLHPALEPIKFESSVGLDNFDIIKIAKRQFRDRGLYEGEFYWTIVEGTFQI